MSAGSAPSSDGATDGAKSSIGTMMVCGRSMRGIGGRRMPVDGGLSGMDENSAAWLSQNEELSWVLHKGLIPMLHARTHMR